MNMLNSIRSLAAKVRSAVVTVLAAPFKPLMQRINTYIDQRLPSASEVANVFGVENVTSDVVDMLTGCPDFRDSIVEQAGISAEAIAEHIEPSDVAYHIDTSDVAQEMDLFSIAGEVDTEDIAQYVEVDPSEVAEHVEIDLDEVAERVEVNPAEVAEHIEVDLIN